MKEKLAVKICENSVVISSNQKSGKIRLVLTASEALMLLDILNNEEAHLKKMASEASPFPIKLNYPSY